MQNKSGRSLKSKLGKLALNTIRPSVNFFSWNKVIVEETTLGTKAGLPFNMDHGLNHKMLTAEWDTCACTHKGDCVWLRLFNTLFPEWKCVTQEKEILSARLSTQRPLRSYRSRLIRSPCSEVPVHIGLLHSISTDHPSSSLWQTAFVRSLGVCLLVVCQNSNRVSREHSQGFTAAALMLKTKPNRTVTRLQYVTQEQRRSSFPEWSGSISASRRH